MDSKIIVEVMRRLEAVFPLINDWTDEIDSAIELEESKDESNFIQLDKLSEMFEMIGSFNDYIEKAVDMLDQMQIAVRRLN